ncbi:MAG: serine--tRNA ligase [Candidatus Thermoplasmatota archaeon]
MNFDLETSFTFSDDVSSFSGEIEQFILDFSEEIEDKNFSLENIKINQDVLSLKLVSTGRLRPHNVLLNLKNKIGRDFGKKHHVGVREIEIISYEIAFDVEKKPLNDIDIPFGQVDFEDEKAVLHVKNVDEEFLQHNYIDRMIKRIKEKVEDQYYEGKEEFWKLIWKSEKKEPIWDKDPTEEMLKQNWLKQGPTKGKWFFYPQAATVLKAMEKIAIKEVLQPLGFQEIVESQVVPFEIWLKTGHMSGMPGEFYYICEPKTRDPKEWEHFSDLVKITNEVNTDVLKKNVDIPKSGVCYAQCPLIYWSLQGKTIAEESLPVLLYDKTAVSGRYESGGRHGIERVDEFHRIEPVYIGTPDQLRDFRDQLLERYKHVFNNILDLEWRMAWVTPWYMQQAGEHGEINQDCGTIDFESYMPYRGNRSDSEWLEFQNLSIIGDKYIDAFNIKTQKSDLWSGCSGIGLERWMTAFLAQKGLNPEGWPKGFKKYLKNLPSGIKFL